MQVHRLNRVSVTVFLGSPTINTDISSIPAGGNNIKTTINGKVVPNYATVQGILIGVVAAFTLVITLFGPEKHGFQFEKHRAAFEEGGGDDDAIIGDDIDQADSHDGETDSQENEKGRAAMIENSEKV